MEISASRHRVIKLGVAVNAIDFKSLRLAIHNFGWFKTVFLVCLVLLCERKIEFSECMELLLDNARGE